MTPYVSKTQTGRPSTAMKNMKVEIDKREDIRQVRNKPNLDAEKDLFSRRVPSRRKIVDNRIPPRAFSESTESIARSVRLLSRTPGGTHREVLPRQLPRQPKIHRLDTKRPEKEALVPVTFPHLNPHVLKKTVFCLLAAKPDRWHLTESALTPKNIAILNRRLISTAILKVYPTPRPVSAFETKLPNITGWVGGKRDIPCLASREETSCSNLVVVPPERYTTAKESRVLHLGRRADTSDMFSSCPYTARDRAGIRSEAGAGMTRGRSLFGLGACRA
jgi:hypothetical protein